MNQGHHDNRLLAALPREAFETMARDLRQVSLPQGRAIYEAGNSIEHIYFPQSGMISLLVVTNNGNAVETGIVGREGAVGLQAALGRRLAFTRATVQIAGRCSTINTNTFAEFVRNYPPLRDLIGKYTEVLLAEAQQLVACNAVHDASSRLCRWLLQSADRSGNDNLPLTQELISQMLGVRRTTVTLLAQSLKDKGIIEYARGQVRILDRDSLERGACECYAILKREELPLTIGVEL